MSEMVSKEQYQSEKVVFGSSTIFDFLKIIFDIFIGRACRRIRDGKEEA